LRAFNFILALRYIGKLVPFLGVTFLYVGVSLLIGIVFGFFLAVAKLGKNKPFKFLAYTYTAILRSIPSVVLIFLVFYGTPAVVKTLFNVNIAKADKIIFLIITLGLYSIAAISEIMRCAYQSINKGQYEAAVSNGLSGFQALWRIMLPQALLVALPNLSNTVVSLIKEGSLGFTIGLVDITGKATLLNAENYSNDILEIYFSLALIYWVVSIGSDKIFDFLDDKLSLEKKLKRLAHADQILFDKEKALCN